MIKEKIENKLLCQAPGNIVSDMDGEKVMLSVKNGKYYNLGEIGGEIWGLLENPTSIDDIVKEMLDTYDVEREQCEKEVLFFIELLLKERLLDIQE